MKAEQAYRRALRQWFALANTQIRRDLTKRIRKDFTTELTDWDFIEQQGQTILKPVTLRVIKSGGEAAYETMNIQGAFSLLNVNAVAAAERETARMVQQVTKSTKAGIRHAIQTGISDGKSMPKIAKELRPMVGLTKNQTQSVENFRDKLERKGAKNIDRKTAKYSARIHRQRTQTIARTESATAQSIGYVEGMRDVGVEKVEFSAYWDADEECLALQGNEYELKDTGGVIPQHPNCRCAWLPVVGSLSADAVVNAPRPKQFKEAQIKTLLGRLKASAITVAQAVRAKAALRRLGYAGATTEGALPVRVTPGVIMPKKPKKKSTSLKREFAHAY